MIPKNFMRLRSKMDLEIDEKIKSFNLKQSKTK